MTDGAVIAEWLGVCAGRWGRLPAASRTSLPTQPDHQSKNKCNEDRDYLES